MGDAAPPHANCGVFPSGSWLAGLVGPRSLEIPPEDHPFWRGAGAARHALKVFAQLEEEKRALIQQLKDTQEAKAATSSAVEWLQASNRKLTDKAAVLQTEVGQLRSQLSQSPQDVRNALAAQSKEVEALREQLRALSERHEALSENHAELLDLQADTESALLDAHTLLQQADMTPPSRAPTPLGADAAVRSLHQELRGAREAAHAAEARALAAEEQRAAAEARARAAEDRLAQGPAFPSPAPSPQPQSPSAWPSGSADAALAAARSVIRRLESQLDSANRQLARSKGAVVGVDGAVDAATYAAAESEACEARDQAAKALTKLDWATGRIKALTASLEDERKQARERELRLKAKVDALQATGSTPTRASEEASLRQQLREARAAGDAARVRERTLEQRVFALERQCAALNESNAAAADLAAVSLSQQ